MFWATTFACIAVIGGIALLFVLMAFSLDPLQVISAGAEPWIDAAQWSAALVAEIIVAAIGLRLWHSARWGALSLATLVAQLAAAVWACLYLRADYF